jgi:hypothetical protein
MKSAADLMALRDELLDDAKRDLDAGTGVAASKGDSRSYVGVALARKEIAFTIDTIARRALKAEQGEDGAADA